MKIQIGTYIVKEAVERTYCPSSYAADNKTHITKPGRYPLVMEFVGGYLFPMPYWLLCLIRVEVKGGAYYSGFCGNNFASTPIAPVADEGYCVQLYDYQLPALVADGLAEVDADFAWLLDERGFKFMQSNKVDWEKLGQMAGTRLIKS